jgi:hypothetical protein
MRKILSDGANIGAVTARTLPFRIREPEAFFYPNSSWRLPFFGDYRFGVSPGVANLDGATFHYSFATGVTPAMEEKLVGQGSPYPWASLDGKGNPFDGSKSSPGPASAARTRASRPTGCRPAPARVGSCPAPLWPAGALVQQDLAAGGHRAPILSLPIAASCGCRAASS